MSAERAPQIVAGALVAEASMKALDIESVDICPWALREGLILRKLDSEADGTALVETSVRDAGRRRQLGPEATHDDRTRRQPQQHATDLGRGVAGEERHDWCPARRRPAPAASWQHRLRHSRRADRRDPDRPEHESRRRRNRNHPNHPGGRRRARRGVDQRRRRPRRRSRNRSRAELETGADDEYEDVDDDYADAVADYAAHLEERDIDADPVDFFAPPPRRPQYTPDASGASAPRQAGVPSR